MPLSPADRTALLRLLDALLDQERARTLVAPSEPSPGHLHVKDPVTVDLADGGTALLISNHPLTWASSNTALARRLA